MEIVIVQYTLPAPPVQFVAVAHLSLPLPAPPLGNVNAKGFPKLIQLMLAELFAGVEASTMALALALGKDQFAMVFWADVLFVRPINRKIVTVLMICMTIFFIFLSCFNFALLSPRKI